MVAVSAMVSNVAHVRDMAEGHALAADLLAALLWQRYDAGRATLVSTNLSREAFAARYLAGEIGARVADRLIHAQGRAITGPDGRRQIGPGGLGWFTAVPAGSLRRVEARVALRGGA